MKEIIAKTAIAITLAAIVAALSGCASYEREEYYESGQLKLKESGSGMTVRMPPPSDCPPK